MDQFIDIYCLHNSRNSKSILAFLDLFLPKREQMANDYLVDNKVFKSTELEELLNFLVNNENLAYEVYWKNLKPHKVEKAMVFFTEDSQMILGLSIRTTSPTDNNASRVFKELYSFGNPVCGYITVDNPPAISSNEFMQECTRMNGLFFKKK